MKRLGSALALICLGLLAYRGAIRAQGPDIGPGEGGAALRDPFAPAPTRPVSPVRPAAPTAVENIFATPPGAPSHPPETTSDGRPRGLAALKPSPKDDLNKDIAIAPAHGAWFISVMSYVGPDAPQMAREFVFWMRSTHKMNAYVFNYGSEERKKEYDRVKEIIDRQKKACEDSGLPLEKTRIRYTYVPDQCAVLVGGYASQEAAKRELERVRKFALPDQKVVKLDHRTIAAYDLNGDKGKTFEQYKPPEAPKELDHAAVNPFKRAFTVPNPSVKREQRTEPEGYDMAAITKLNRGEPFSLLECKKPFTLAITHFRTPAGLEETSPSGAGVLAALGIGKKKQREDYAATNANILVEHLRKDSKLEAYVLHMRFSSVVCVGSFDGAEDPSLRSLKALVQERIRLPGVEMFPEPYLMKVPR